MNISFFKFMAGIVALLAGWLPAIGQSALPYVIASTGSSGTATNGSTVNFTVGEPFIATIGTSPQLTQGFQQPNTSGNPLPVELLDFSGLEKNGYNFLSWHTAQEKNNDYFNIERSADGSSFQAIGKVYTLAAGGNSSSELGYTYTDRTMPAGISYYRLRQVDRDKQAVYSDVIRLEQDGTAQHFALSPNPTKGKVLLYASVYDRAQVQITDVSGKEIRTIKLTGPVTEIDLGSLSGGTYFIRYANGQNSETVKLIKD